MTSRTRSRKQSKTDHPSRVHCAIYTRKSTSEGLEQEFNSLDAQREACEAYIASQKHEGWICLPERYDDGGLSGGSMDRPALKTLLADVKEDKIDCVVVYKVDRLSRSLLDFSRIMATLDDHQVSFVSITQQFNTTTSMGRLTLNMLLSFAQFEREIIAERTKDKMSAARRKGKWVGGRPALGYDLDPEGGRLLVNEEEAERVRGIFDLYLETESLTETVRELRRRAWTTKRWVTRKGTEQGGCAFEKNRLSYLLRNRIYIGQVSYGETVYEGEHPGIVDPDIWERAQKLLGRNGQSGGRASRNKYGALIRGLLHCANCDAPMDHTCTRKGKRQYRYYVCREAQKKGWDSCPTKSLPAGEIERFVVDQIRGVGSDPKLVDEVHRKVRSEVKGVTRSEVAEALCSFDTVWESLSPREQARLLHLLVERIAYDGETESIAVTFQPNGIRVLMPEKAA